MENIKKFEDFLDRMQGLLDNAKKQGHIIVRAEDLESTFPELKESEDERMKKYIKLALISMGEELSCFYSTHHTSEKELINWLENQNNDTCCEWNDVRYVSTIQNLEYAKSLDSYNQYGKEDIDKNIDWLKSLKLKLSNIKNNYG